MPLNHIRKQLALAAICAGALAACSGPDAATGNKPAADNVTEEAGRSYEAARALQKSGDYDQAIAGFEKVIAMDIPDASANDSTIATMDNALKQLMNTYQQKGKPNECADYFKRLMASPSAFMKKYCKRDLYSVAAYAFSRTEEMDLAEQTMDSALSMALVRPTPERLFRDYAYAAAVFYPNPLRQEQVIELSKKALEQAKLCDNKSGAQYVRTMLGTLYRRTRRITDASDILLESANEAQKSNDVNGEVNAYNAMVDLFLYWQIPEYADTYATNAVNRVKEGGVNPAIATQAYLMKGQTELALNKPESAVVCYKTARQLCQDLPYNSGMADVDCKIGFYIVEWCIDESLPEGIEMLNRVAKNGTAMNRAKAFYGLGLAYIRLKDNAKAEEALDSMYNLTHMPKNPVILDVNYDMILRHFIQLHDAKNVERYAICQSEEFLYNGDASVHAKMYETVVSFQAQQKEQQLNIAKKELENKSLQHTLWMLALLTVIALLTIVALYSKKIYGMRRKLLEGQLTETITNLAVETQRKDEAERSLSQLLSDKDKRKEIKAVTPALIQEQGEAKFRLRFEQLYPLFIPTLREKAPAIGKREELLCMLIVLGQDTEQIARLMGISRSSVNMSRHRLRQKLNLDKNESLEIAIANIKHSIGIDD